MDIKEVMVLVKGEDKTEEINNVEHNIENGTIVVTYKGGTSYPYNHNSVVIIKKPKVIEFDGYVAYVEGMPVYEPQLILDFGPRIRIINYRGKPLTVEPKSFKLLKDGATNQNAKQLMAYLKDISQYTANNPKEGTFLEREMNQLTFIHPESVLSCYINQQSIKQRTPETSNIIFPFRFNLSQKAALENAIKNSISVIDGPPGTGKTQTILNILANIVAIQGKTVAVVSNNNEAVKNVMEKMSKAGYGFLMALLGKESNQETFFANIPIAQVKGWDFEEEKDMLVQMIENINIKLNKLLMLERKKAQLYRELRGWQLEQEHFEIYYAKQDVEKINKLPLFKATPDRIISFLAETSFAKENNQSSRILFKLKLLLKYGVFDHKKLQSNELSILLLLQKEFYIKQIFMLQKEIDALENQLNTSSFEKLISEHKKYSEKLFRKYLYQRFNNQHIPDFTKRNYKIKFQDFIKTFPIILSTTHALRRSIPQNYLLDYVIIDEASQVDLITGSLVFSCCKNVIIVGDVKQLPQITDKKIEQKLGTTLPHPDFNYFQHNILSSIINVYGDSLPREILREHYRCHPRIIEFCNQKYYDGELISYTSDNLSECPLVLYKTTEGNHLRRITRGEKSGNYNQRELDVIVNEILTSPSLLENQRNIGFVTPYRMQANKADQLLSDSIESDTVHKYQGREKDVMIMSTVLDSSRNGRMGLKFVDDPQMINVAVSRAIKQFVLVTDHDFFFENGNHIGDLMRYIQYSTLDRNVIESNIVSVFDLLYQKYSSKLISLKEKMNQNARFRSEEALRVLLKEILQEPEFNQYNYTHGMLLRNLLNNIELLTTEEQTFVNNRASLDFVVYHKQDKTCTLVIEVDGFEFHENNPKQLRRDRLKDAILAKYGVTMLRLATNGSSERENIQKALRKQ
ncbi:AAA domain-containing protein [Ruminiclostridium cellobioparum]|uniref:DNA helicase n=1 Tax=Ruminiclostridium cellobioparum subsp. termitidis CT1112 TaxID=1195236 RepID=S0FSX2_RUMCE|nr:AAA domain-containing protein [Ruminiclostridium cellobioparum]EMS72274.1 hypothetical protein CTER_1716 [Ruminiclostridium cellobioparum subsp. termitidis CT1112]